MDDQAKRRKDAESWAAIALDKEIDNAAKAATNEKELYEFLGKRWMNIERDIDFYMQRDDPRVTTTHAKKWRAHFYALLVDRFLYGSEPMSEFRRPEWSEKTDHTRTHDPRR